MPTVKENLIAAKIRFISCKANQMQPVVYAIVQGMPNALETLVALRESLPEGFSDFRDFESSRLWSRKAALQTFDRAIDACS